MIICPFLCSSFRCFTLQFRLHDNYTFPQNIISKLVHDSLYGLINLLVALFTRLCISAEISISHGTQVINCIVIKITSAQSLRKNNWKQREFHKEGETRHVLSLSVTHLRTVHIQPGIVLLILPHSQYRELSMAWEEL